MNPLLLATVIVLVLNFIPELSVIVYPLQLLITFVHEGCHALAAMVTGGSVRGMAVNQDGSGLTLTVGGNLMLIASAGYLGTLLMGLICIKALQYRVSSRLVLGTLGFTVALNVAYAQIFSFTSWSGVLLIAAIFAAAISPLATLAAWFVSLQLLLGAFYDLRNLIGNAEYTDAALMAQATGIPATLWVIFWLTISIIITWKVLVPRFALARA